MGCDERSGQCHARALKMGQGGTKSEVGRKNARRKLLAKYCHRVVEGKERRKELDYRLALR